MTKKKAKYILNRLLTEVPQLTAIHHIGAYAAQAAYFFVLSLIPIILLLLTMVQYTPLTKADVMTLVLQIFPASVNTMMTSIVNQVYNQSTGIIPITILVALWSAGKGVLALNTGFNSINQCLETRNYFFLRIRSSFYTILFIVVLIVLLVLSVFGNTLNAFIIRIFPLAAPGLDFLMSLKTFVMPLMLFLFLVIVYTYLPNKKMHVKLQLLGACFGTIGCLLASVLFSVYLTYFPAFSSMYGSLTTIILVMLWMYFCMYAILLGSEVNRVMERIVQAKERQEAKIQKESEKMPKVVITSVETIEGVLDTVKEINEESQK